MYSMLTLVNDTILYLMKLDKRVDIKKFSHRKGSRRAIIESRGNWC